MEYTLIAIGGLVLLVILGGVAYARKSKQVGVLKTENKALRAGQEAGEREQKAIDQHATTGDLNDDDAVMRELGHK